MRHETGGRDPMGGCRSQYRENSGLTHLVVNLTRVCLLLCLLVLAACATFNPQKHDTIGYRDRAVSKTQGGVTVSVVALGPEEAQKAFGLPIVERGIQPVWLRLENKESQTFLFAPIALDPMFYTPAEAAFINHSWTSTDQTNQAVDALFQHHAMQLTIPPGQSVEGFVYVTPKLGSKFLSVLLIGDEDFRKFRFVVDVPGLALPAFDTDSIYPADQIKDYTLAELPKVLEALPCCVTDASGEIQADPLNFVIIGEELDAWAALVASGWEDAETVTTGTAMKTAGSFLFGSEYKYSPISPLYVFGRHQDAGFQKARSDIDERNHLRVWLTPMRVDGRPVWIGAISRDIGVIRSGFGTTHKIDPDVDAERWYLAQNLALAQSLESFGYVRGGPISTVDAPKSSVEPKNIFFSDGLRIVLVVPGQPVSVDDIQVLDWIPIEDVDLESKFTNRSLPDKLKP